MNINTGMQTLYTNAIADDQSITNQLNTLQAQASTGQQYANVSDNPGVSLNILSDNDQNQLLTTHLSNIQATTASLNTSVSALQNVASILSQAQSLAVQASNSANDTSSFGALAQQVSGLISQLLTTANTQNNGVYVFSGTATSTQPYAVTHQDGQGNPLTISYQGSNNNTSTIIDTNQQVPVDYAGNQVFQSSDRQPAVFSGNTGAQPGSGTNSSDGQQTLTFTHTATTYAAGSGVQAGASSASGDTILGSHSLQIIDTSGNGSAGTVALDGGTPIPFTNADTNLQLTNNNGDTVYLDTSAITAGFNGAVAVNASGSMSVDGGATSTPIDFSANQTVTDGQTGAATFVNTTNVQRTGNETVANPGTYDAFSVLIALRNDLNNTNNLSSTAQIQAISNRIADLENVSTHVETTIGAQSSTVQSLTALQTNLNNLQLSNQETISNLGSADVTNVVVQLQAYENMLQMSLEAFSKISSTSLLNYLH